MRMVLRRVDPGHGRDIPSGQNIARALRIIFRRQQREVMAKLRRNPERVPSLAHWTAPMAEAMEPLLHGYYAEGIRGAMRRIRRQLRAKTNGDRIRDRQSSRREARWDGTKRSAQIPGGFGLRESQDVGFSRGSLRDGAITRKDEGDPNQRILDVFDPAFDVFNPRVLDAIRQAVFAFCDATNQTATRELGRAIADLRRELSTGLERGEALSQLTARVQEIFDDPMRAFRIATTEASRAVHAGQLIAAQESGVVTGKRWLASSDACPLCLPLDGVEVPLDQPFVIAGVGPYAVIMHPPRHPHCMCTWTEVLA